MPIRHDRLRSMPAAAASRRGDSSIRGAAGALLLTLLLNGIAYAGKPVFNSGTRQVMLLELYTSQGCSSCPPAERWLNEYLEDDTLWTEIVPLAFHVDYWDYLGWNDAYANRENGERQRDYARAGKARSVYTPGLFTNGREWRGWTLRLPPRDSDREPGNLSVAVGADRVTASFVATSGPVELHVALLGFDIETRVERGENRNTTLTQQFVVLAHTSHLSSDGYWEVPLPQATVTAPRYAIAAWISTPGDPTPLQATGGWLPAREPVSK
jgi:hypothetical protein